MLFVISRRLASLRFVATPRKTKSSSCFHDPAAALHEASNRIRRTFLSDLENSEFEINEVMVRRTIMWLTKWRGSRPKE